MQWWTVSTKLQIKEWRHYGKKTKQKEKQVWRIESDHPINVDKYVDNMFQRQNILHEKQPAQH